MEQNPLMISEKPFKSSYKDPQDLQVEVQGTWEDVATVICESSEDFVDVTAAPVAMKADSGKPDLSHIYIGFMVEVARAMDYGAKKYKRGDYLNGHKATQIVSALLRHTMAWLWGEENDAESGVSHLGHMGANIMMIIHQRDVGSLKDDRMKP